MSSIPLLLYWILVVEGLILLPGISGMPTSTQAFLSQENCLFESENPAIIVLFLNKDQNLLVEQCDIQEGQSQNESNLLSIKLKEHVPCEMNLQEKFMRIQEINLENDDVKKKTLDIYSMKHDGKLKLLQRDNSSEHNIRIGDSKRIYLYSSLNEKINIKLTKKDRIIRSLQEEKDEHNNLLIRIIFILLKFYFIAGILMLVVWIFMTCIRFNQRLVQWRVAKFNSEQLKISSISKHLYHDSSTIISHGEESKVSDSDQSSNHKRESTGKPLEQDSCPDSSASEGPSQPTLSNPGLELAKNIIMSAFKEKAMALQERTPNEP
ncbi:unnamed protein product [Moneuplotes crassus]|uniref:Uncharacterized protein n=1 Tax=Euplotes crassus TaxID=5936 RepID=A0AAD1UM00_EUPCR|nr:unnamed protein product [Moneuplotes crassus]